MSMIKKKVLAPAAATHSPKEMEERYKYLMGLVGHTDNDSATLDDQNKWKLPGQRGRSWLAAGVNQKRKQYYTMNDGQQAAKKAKKEATVQAAQSTVGRRSSRRSS